MRHVNGGQRCSRAFVAGIAVATGWLIALVLLVVAQGWHFSRDVPDGAVLFMMWTLIACPIVSLGVLILAIVDLTNPRVGKHHSYIGLGISLCSLTACVAFWGVLTGWCGSAR